MDKSPFETSPEEERWLRLEQLFDAYLSDDKELVSGMDEQDKLGFAYGELQYMGYDPDEIFKEFSITESTDEV